MRGTALAGGLAREYSLDEIAIVTRAGPARLLGLPRKGHLGPGADADLALYAPGPDIAAMFAFPRYVFKAGVPVVVNGEVRDDVYGRVHRAWPEYDTGVEPGLRAFLEEEGSLAFEDYVVRDPA